MKEKDLLHLCRYYKGGELIKETDPDRQTFEKIEKGWLDTYNYRTDSTEELISRVMEEYLLVGLGDFEKFDDTPITLKALLFNRFTKYNERIDVVAFKKWYQKYKEG